MEKEIISMKRTIRSLSSEELSSVSGGFWPVVLTIGGIVLACVAEGYRHKLDPGALRREGMGN